MKIAGQSTGRMNPAQACLYMGLQLEEMAEKLRAVAGGTVTPMANDALLSLVTEIEVVAQRFKDGLHMGDIVRANHADLIDADIDLAWVSVGALISTSPQPYRAISHCAYTNLDKFRGGVCVKDASGKVQKPADWAPPDFTPYVDPNFINKV
jgi:predicted HAD superfamily Cof-like phosphohydrolase